MKSRRAAALALALMSLAAAPAVALPGAAKAPPPKFAETMVLQEVVNDPNRAKEFSDRDGPRHPVETLSFWGLKPGQTVLELGPGAGYWTEILAMYAKRTGGRFIGTAADLSDPATSDAAKAARVKFAQRFSDEARFGKIQLTDLGPKSGPLAPPGTVDLIVNARTVHNWLGPRFDKVLADSFAALKPGGLLGIEDHRADPRPMVAGASDGYVSEAAVIAAAQKAGFTFDGRSDINANPRDTKDHPFGVWTLPPTRRTAPAGQPEDPSFDRAKYDAIGESDRMTLRFRKPG